MQIQAAKPIPLSTIRVNKDKIQLRPSFQRGLVWDKERRQMLVDSILKEKYIPEVLFGQSENQDFDEAVIDGQQRINTVLDFMDNKIKVKIGTVIDDNDVGDLTFDDLPEKLQERVKAYTFNVVRINGTKEEVEDMFIRLQGGVALNKVETRHSIGGKIKSFVKEMLQHPFFADSVGVTTKNNKRLKFYEVAEQICLLEVKGITTDIKHKNISELYNEYNQDGIPQEVRDKIMDKLDFLNNAFAGSSKTLLAKKVNIINVYLVATEFMADNNKHNDYASEFANWYKAFDENRTLQKKMNPMDRNRIYDEYFQYAAAGTGSKESLQGRKQVLIKSWEQWLKESRHQSA